MAAILNSFFNWASQYFAFTDGLWAVLILLPLLIFYLIKPKPRQKTIPALLFLMQEKRKLNKNSFFRRIMNNPILLLQILIILVIAASMAKPFILVEESKFVENTVVILDVSASMQAPYSGNLGNAPSRFDKAIELAKQNLGASNTLILAGTIPEVTIDEKSRDECINTLENLKPTDSRSALFDAILTATNYAKTDDIVVVISDFIETESDNDLNVAKKILKSKGIKTKIISLVDESSEKLNNVGFISVDVSDSFTTLVVKNFNDAPEFVLLNIEGAHFSNSNINETNSIDISALEREISPRSQEIFSFTTIPGTAKVVLTADNDDFKLDNTAFLSAPSDEKTAVMYMYNDKGKYLGTALDILDNIELNQVKPPAMPDVKEPIMIIDKIDSSLLLPRVIPSIEKQVRSGGALIITAQDKLFGIDFKGMLPVTLNSDTLLDEGYAFVDQENPITKDVTFGALTKYYDVSPKNGSMVLASTGDGVPIIVMKKHGDGTVIYYGIFDEFSDFKMDMYYPIFWKRLTDFLIDKSSLQSLNKKTGEILTFHTSRKVQTPQGNVKTKLLKLNNAGNYVLDDRTIAVNLASSKESDLNGAEIDSKIKSDPLVQIEEKAPRDITMYVILGILALLFLELIALKIRGDI